MKLFPFQVVIEEDQFEDGRPAFHAYCPSLKSCRTWGHTYSEALSKIQEVIEIYIADDLERIELN
jgi:predicted RNase H-like HicB family nuclease